MPLYIIFLFSKLTEQIFTSLENVEILVLHINQIGQLYHNLETQILSWMKHNKRNMMKTLKPHILIICQNKTKQTEKTQCTKLEIFQVEATDFSLLYRLR